MAVKASCENCKYFLKSKYADNLCGALPKPVDIRDRREPCIYYKHYLLKCGVYEECCKVCC